uniref:Uncharacterized protein n=1 Tax=Opuntia streptacantha TaxID=393608 RepID=A0A7C9CMJ6_OPUST
MSNLIPLVCVKPIDINAIIDGGRALRLIADIQRARAKTSSRKLITNISGGSRNLEQRYLPQFWPGINELVCLVLNMLPNLCSINLSRFQTRILSKIVAFFHKLTRVELQIFSCFFQLPFHATAQ